MGSGRLKPGWTRVAFGDVVQLSTERSSDPESAGFKRYVGLEHLDPGELAIRRWGDVADGTTFTTIFRPGQVLFGKRRAYLRKVALPDFDGVCSGDIYVLEPMSERHLLPELLPYLCQTEDFLHHAVGTSAGSLSPRTHWRSLAVYEFALPPLDEQHRIANALSAVAGAFQTCSGLEHSLRQVELSAVQALLDGNEHRPTVPVVDLLLEPPRNGTSASPISQDEARHSGMKTVSVSAVGRGGFDPAHAIKHVEIDVATARPFLVRDGDVFVVRGNGNRTLCGQAGLAEASYDDLIYPDKLIRLRFNSTQILPPFAVAQWNLPTVHRELSARAKSTNGNWMINGKDVRAHELVVPTLSKQRRALRVITRMRHLRGMELKRRADGLARVRSILLNSWASFGE